MGDLFTHATSGTPMNGLSADAWNALLDMLKDYRKRFARSAASPGDIKVQIDTDIRFNNICGAPLSQFAIVGRGAGQVVPTAPDYFFGPIVFDTASPLEASPFAILQQPATPDSVALARVTGWSLALIQITNSAHHFAAPIDGDYAKLASATAGPARIWYSQTLPAASLSATMLTGITPPSGGVGADGDWYTDTSANKYYGPKTAGVWATGTPLGLGVVWAIVTLIGHRAVQPERGPVVYDTSGILVNGKYDGLLDLRDSPNEIWYDQDGALYPLLEPIWIIDLADSLSLPAGSRYDAVPEPAEVGGPFLVSIIDPNIGNALTDTAAWSVLLDPSPSVWSAGFYAQGSYVSHAGHNYLQINPAGTADTPGASANWLQADILSSAGPYAGGAVYHYDPLTATDYVQEERALYAIRSAPGGIITSDTIWCNNTVLAGVSTLRASAGIASSTRLSQGIFKIVFIDSFAGIHDFEWQGGAVGDALEEVPATRTVNSVTVQTVSGDDPLEWGISINGGPPGPNRIGTLGMTLGSVKFSATGILSGARTGTAALALKNVLFSALGTRSTPPTGTVSMALKRVLFSAIATSTNRRLASVGLLLKPVRFASWGAISPSRTGTAAWLLKPVRFASWGAISPSRTGAAAWLLKPVAFSAGAAGTGTFGKPGDFRAKLSDVGTHAFGPIFAPTYTWAEQTKDGDGNLVTLAGGRSGTAVAGPWMRELNDNFTSFPTFVFAKARGLDAFGVMIYDYENCCVGVPAPARTGTLGMTLGAVVFAAAGTFTALAGITSTPLGTASTAGTSCSTSVAVVDGDLLVITLFVQELNVFTITYADSSGSYTGPSIHSAGGAFGPGAFRTEVHYIEVPVGSGGAGTVTLATSGAQVMMFAAELVSGLANNAADINVTATGTASTPDSGNSLTATSLANSYVAGGAGMVTPPGSIVWQNGFSSCGQDVSITVAGTVYKLATGQLILSATQHVDAALNASAAQWGAVAAALN